MELDFQLTPRTKILLGILGAVLLILIGIQGVPAFYRLFANQGAKVKQEQLLNAENLVHAAEVLKPIESEIYKATGLASTEEQQARSGNQGAATLFDTQLPETVIRARIDALVKRAGIQQNYQLLTKPGTGKQTQKLTMQNRERLVLYLYLKHIEAEESELTEIAEQAAEADTFDMLMDAWLTGTETEADADEKEETSSGAELSTEKIEAIDEAQPANPIAPAAQWEFVSMPETIPLAIRAKLAGYIKSMVTQQLRGATDFRQGFFDAQVFKVTTPATPGIFGIGAKPATVAVQLRKDSVLLDILMQTSDAYAEEPTDTGELQSVLVKYIERIQKQSADLLEKLALSPPTYETQLYTVEMKFKTDLEKLVNLNHLIETDAKWLIVRDLRISADKQGSGAGAARGRNREGSNATNLNVDILLIARIF
ncbi:hypothetical protein F4141_09960 [Candidatus Poribacteria bacterium]|nr:hypothetical protein [Candidatus Poribacteria bacterium]MYH81014.1 hypothetical protein [Candidatus Poribacteria bacterium]